MGKITSYTWRGLVCDVKAAVSLRIVDIFSLKWLTKVSYLVLCDQPIGLYGLLPLEEDHVIERGEGQGLRSDAARNYSRREKQPSLKQTLHPGLKLMDSCAGMLWGKNTFDRAKRHRAKEGWTRKREQRDRAEGRWWKESVAQLAPSPQDELRFWLPLSDNRAPCLGGWQSIFLL